MDSELFVRRHFIEVKVVSILVRCSKESRAIALKLGGFDLRTSQILQVRKKIFGRIFPQRVTYTEGEYIHIKMEAASSFSQIMVSYVVVCERI